MNQYTTINAILNNPLWKSPEDREKDPTLLADISALHQPMVPKADYDRLKFEYEKLLTYVKTLGALADLKFEVDS